MSLYAYEEIDFVFRLKSRSWKTGKKFTVLHIIELLLLGEEQTTVFSNKANRHFQFPCRASIYASLSVTKESCQEAWETDTRLWYTNHL